MNRSRPAHFLRRLLNLGRKVRAGLTPFGENVSPEVRNDLFIAHLSIYHFAASNAHDARVLDIGCGAGYGSEYLRKAGASAVVGLDIDPRNIRYARRHYPANDFRVADAQHLPPMRESFDLAVASNVLEHLDDVRPALDALHALLAPKGRLIVAVPPIVDDASLRANEAIPYHRSNHMIGIWIDYLSTRFADVRMYRHYWRPGVEPDFNDPFPSRLTVDDFFFEELTPAAFPAQPTLTALFVATARLESRATPEQSHHRASFCPSSTL